MFILVDRFSVNSLSNLPGGLFVAGGSFLGSTLSALAPVRLGSGVSFTSDMRGGRADLRGEFNHFWFNLSVLLDTRIRSGVVYFRWSLMWLDCFYGRSDMRRRISFGFGLVGGRK
jgi:hypothetical protein